MLKKEEYIKTVRRPYPPFYFSLIHSGSSETKNYQGLFKEKLSTRNFVVVNHWIYYAKKEIKAISHAVFKYWKNKENFEKAKAIILEKEKALLASTKKDFETFCKAYEQYMSVLVSIWRADEPVAEKVKSLLLEKLPQEEAEEIMLELNMPLPDNFYKQEEYKLVLTKNLKAHVKKWEWLNARYGSREPYTLKEAKERLSKTNKKDYLKKYHEEKEHLKQKIAYTKKMVGKENEHFIDLMQFIIYYRTQRTDIMNRSAYEAIPLLEKKAKQLGLTYDEILYCTKYEILSKIPSKEIIHERMKDSVNLLEDGKESVLTGKECERIKELFKEDVSNVSEVKGQIACKGKIRGKARIILSNEDHLEKGEILITAMTIPNMIHLMKKAAAFVTDEGGITCHAAIIAREMKKPCIIGTKIATQVFKDGDYVEVDAEKGIVKLLKRKGKVE